LFREVSVYYQFAHALAGADNGQEATQIIKENKDKFSAILMDVRMPVMNGNNYCPTFTIAVKIIITKESKRQQSFEISLAGVAP